VAYSPRQDYLVALYGIGDLVLWNAADGTIVRSWIAHPAGATTLAFTPNGEALATVGRDHVLRYWSVPEGTLLHEYQEETMAPNALAFSPGGFMLALARRDATIIQTRNPLALPPHFTALQRQADGSTLLSLELSSLQGLDCSIQSSTELAAWHNEISFSVTNSSVQWLDPATNSMDRRFYRLASP
jgi:WD40 repeat protein